MKLQTGDEIKRSADYDLDDEINVTVEFTATKADDGWEIIIDEIDAAQWDDEKDDYIEIDGWYLEDELKEKIVEDLCISYS